MFSLGVNGSLQGRNDMKTSLHDGLREQSLFLIDALLRQKEFVRVNGLPKEFCAFLWAYANFEDPNSRLLHDTSRCMQKNIAVEYVTFAKQTMVILITQSFFCKDWTRAKAYE